MSEDKTEDMCPICRASRYLNPDMKFLVNPECYHKMCESCVDRIFSVGPAPCPYKGCGRILRKGRFKTQVFDDLKVEREVDIRHRVLKLYNKREDDFESEQEYNNYLEHIEDLVFDIMAGGPARAKAEAEISEYERENKKDILQNALRQREEDAANEKMQQYEVERQRKLHLLAIELQQNEQEALAAKEQELVATLAATTGRKTRKIVQDIEQRTQEHIAELRKAYHEEINKPQYKKLSGPSVKRDQQPVESIPFTPFAGDRQIEQWSLRDKYFDPTMGRANTSSVKAGGFSAKGAQHEAITLAFMGMTVDVQSEKALKNIEQETETDVKTEVKAEVKPEPLAV